MTDELHKVSLIALGGITKPPETEGGQPIKLVYQRVAKGKGNLGNIGRYGYQLRRELPRTDAKTSKQLAQREKLAAGTAAWKKLMISEQIEWKWKARGLKLTGYNLFMREYMKQAK